jgi:Zn-dependent peptidase ImmA (M78 family)
MSRIHPARRLQIRRKAEELIDDIRRGKEDSENRVLSDFEMPPIDPVAIATQSGIRLTEIEKFSGTRVIGALNRDRKELEFAVGNISPERRRYTIAHELGHFCLHSEMIHYREDLDDRSARPQEEEADAFAADLLMPAKSVLAVFERYFGAPIDRRTLNEDMAYMLTGGKFRPSDVARMSRHDFARLIATATSSAGRQFERLAKVFVVSVDAMAYRLEELDLVL